MMDASGNLLPVYNTLFNLIHVQWNSTGFYKLDSNGRLNFTGFYGQYQIFQQGNLLENFSLLDTRPNNDRPFTINQIPEYY